MAAWSRRCSARGRGLGIWLRLPEVQRGAHSGLGPSLVATGPLEIGQAGDMEVEGPTCAVRAAGRGDLLAILGVYAQRDSDVQLPDAASDREAQVWQRMMSTPDLTVYVAEIEGVAVGTATLLMMPNLTYSGPTAFVEAVVVAVGHRRKRIATSMLRHVLREASLAGCNKVQLLSHRRHATDGAHRLYTALGFEPEAEGFRIYLKDVPKSVEAAKPK